jgi:Rad3-related DNA helicase
LEPDTEKEAREMKYKYDHYCEKSEGAIFFISARGRLLEGIDFKDN